MERPSEPIAPSTLIIAAVVFYSLMSAAAMIILSVTGNDAGLIIFGAGAGDVDVASAAATPTEMMSVPLAALLGAGAGLVIVFLSVALRRIGPLERLQKEFGAVLGEPTTSTIAVLAVTSAVGEELLFRGALLPLLGFWPTAILFGLLHGGGTPRLLPWTIFAFVSGILLGALAYYTGSLLAPILCHLTINFWNLQQLGAPAPEAPR